jgi:hypothetical protein
MLLSFAHSMSMKQPVALQSMRACVHRLTALSVDLISMSTTRDIGPGLTARWVTDTPRLEGNCIGLEWWMGGGLHDFCTVCKLVWPQQ